MKTSEDFRRDFGEADDSFRACIRQTLTDLECKEEKPVKKKMNLGLVLALIVTLLTGTAIAEEQWGILSFLRKQGREATEEQLLPLYAHPYLEPTEHNEIDLVDAVITEALYEDGMLYLAVSLRPLQERSLVVPLPGAKGNSIEWEDTDPHSIDLSGIRMQDALQNPSYGDVSVLDYAREHGFDRVVVMDGYSVSLSSKLSAWLADQFGGVQRAEFNLLADGTLQMILEVAYKPDMTFAHERQDITGVMARVWAFDVKEGIGLLYGHSTGAHASYVLPDDRYRLCSVPEDAHDIVGYIGEMDYICIAPFDEEYMTITIQLNMRDDVTEDTWMTGPAWIIMDEEGNRLCRVDESQFIGLSTSFDPEGNRYSITHGVFPAEFMPKDGKLILRAENRINYNIVYDEYTYTLEAGQTELTGE